MSSYPRRPRAFVIDGRTAELERAPVAEVASASSGYFEVLKTPVLRGRVFTEADRPTGQQVAVINEALVRQYWGDHNPIGQQIRFVNRSASLNRAPLTIVSVVGDIKSDGFDAGEAPYIYTPALQAPTYGSVVYLRSSGNPSSLGEAIRREVQAVDPTIPVFSTRTMDEVVAKSLAARRFTLRMLGVFAAVAFLLAAIGIYGVMAYTFSQRTSEIGLRIALGAQRGGILKIVLSEAALIMILGVAGGLIGSLTLTRFLQTMLFDIKATDPITFSTLAALLAAVALLACLIPAHRASRVDPLIALRHE
jgi:predicted permease